MSEGHSVYLGLFRKHTRFAKCHWKNTARKHRQVIACPTVSIACFALNLTNLEQPSLTPALPFPAIRQMAQL